MGETFPWLSVGISLHLGSGVVNVLIYVDVQFVVSFFINLYITVMMTSNKSLIFN